MSKDTFSVSADGVTWREITKEQLRKESGL